MDSFFSPFKEIALTKKLHLSEAMLSERSFAPTKVGIEIKKTLKAAFPPVQYSIAFIGLTIISGFFYVTDFSTSDICLITCITLSGFSEIESIFSLTRNSAKSG